MDAANKPAPFPPPAYARMPAPLAHVTDIKSGAEVRTEAPPRENLAWRRLALVLVLSALGVALLAWGVLAGLLPSIDPDVLNLL